MTIRPDDWPDRESCGTFGGTGVTGGATPVNALFHDEYGGTAVVSARPFAYQKPLVINLRHGLREPGAWRLRIDGHVLSLAPPNSPPVLTVDHTQAAHCIRFGRDIKGRLMVRFTVVPGLREYAFPCDRGEMEFVMAWLPQKPRTETRAGVIKSGLSLILFAVLHIALAQWTAWPVGALLFVAGAASIVWRRARAHLLMGAALAVAGTIHLVPWHTLGIVDATPTETMMAIRSVVGATLVLFGIQQFSMIGPNELLRSARRRADGNIGVGTYRTSALVRRLARASLATGMLLGAYAVLSIVVNGPADHPWQIGEVQLPPILSNLDATIGAIFGIVCLTMAATLRRVRKPAYSEARIALQFLIGIATVVLWGAVTSYRPDAPLAMLDGVLTNGAVSFAIPHVWVTLIVGVLIANVSFLRSLDRELEQAQL